jgi:hypothetical protein
MGNNIGKGLTNISHSNKCLWTTKYGSMIVRRVGTKKKKI